MAASTAKRRAEVKKAASSRKSSADKRADPKRKAAKRKTARKRYSAKLFLFHNSKNCTSKFNIFQNSNFEIY